MRIQTAKKKAESSALTLTEITNTPGRDVCPAGAIKGVLYHEGQPLEDRLDVFACDRYLQEQRLSFGKRICGLCIAACPYGKR